LHKAEKAVREDRADVQAISRERSDMLVTAGPPKFDSFAQELRQSIAAENEDIEGSSKFKIEYDQSRVMEVSYRNVTMTVRYNPGAFSDGLGPHPPSMDVTFGPNPTVAAYIPGLGERMPGVGASLRKPVVASLRVFLLSGDASEVSWNLEDVDHEDDDLAGELLERFETYFRKHKPPV